VEKVVLCLRRLPILFQRSKMAKVELRLAPYQTQLNKSPAASLRTASGVNLPLRHQPGSFSRSVSAIERKAHKNQ
jgi:hypothetical protein